jgi:AbrB family looped-hinge helix DNA binding protein
MLTAKVLAKGQVVIPKEIREKVSIAPGDRLQVNLTPEGIVLVPLRRTHTERFRGIVQGRLSLDELETLYAQRP